MLIQPIVENSIVHGLAGEKGMVRVYAIIDTEEVSVVVEDNGKGMDKETVENLMESFYKDDVKGSGEIEHVALKNIQKRIRMVCGEKYGINIESVPGEGTKVSVRLPRYI